MANNETDLELTVGAVADKNSAKKAVQDIAKEVNNSVKGGRIDITIPIDISKDKLTKAQKDVVAEISKFTSKGFSASGKDIDKLTSKFNEFTKMFDQAGKGRQNKLFREIRKQVEDLQKLYKESQNIQKATRTHDTKIKNSKTSRRKTNYISDEEIAANIKAEQKRRTKGIKQAGPKGYGSGWVDPGRTNEREAKLSEMSSYKSNMARQMKQSELDFYKTNDKAKVQTRINKEEANRLAEEALAKTKSLSPAKKAQGLSEDLTNKMLPELLRKIQISDDDKTISDLTEKFFSTIDAISKLNQDAGKSVLNDIKKELDVIMRNLGFSVGGKIGGTEGKDKTAKSRDPKMEGLLKGLFVKIEQKENAIREEIIKLEQLEKNPSTKSSKEINSFANKTVAEIKTNNDVLKQNAKATEKQTSYDKIENAAERVADSAEGKKNQELINKTQEDLSSGFNTDDKADTAIKAIKDFQQFKDTFEPCKDVLQAILKEIQSISQNGIDIHSKEKGQKLGTKDENINNILQSVLKPAQQALLSSGKPVPMPGTYKSHYEGKDLRAEQRIRRILEEDSKRTVSGDVLRSTIFASIKDPSKWFIRLKDNLASLVGITANYKKVMTATSKEQDELSAKTIKEYGLARGRDITGDKITFARSMSLWRDKDKFKSLFPNLQISKGIEIDTTKITDRLGKVLSGKQMRNAQMGGSLLRNIIGYGTGFIGMPSLEKSRAAAEALNQINANVREAMNNILKDIQDKESALAGMAESGDLKLGVNGEVLEGSTTEAKTMVAQLENAKLLLDSLLADMGRVDIIIDKSHGKIGRIMKQLSFTSPLLRENNAIVNNINAGYDKGGKALKFQTRIAEILNYTVQLMGRHIGQILKSWALMLNPINLIKKAFGIFTGYNTKWQRTMNVIKYNIHAILEPFMDKVAQFLVNCIGFVDIISMKVQEAFGHIPISLFDQAAAESQKIKEELEAAANVTAGFDELHDIGSDNSGANDLMGEIYKPKLPKEWEDMANKIGDFFAKIIPNIKNIGKYITEHWKRLLATLLGIFLGWKLLKYGGKLLLNALFGDLMGTAGTSLFSKIGAVLGKGLYTGMSGSVVTIGKLIGGVLLTAGGTYGAFKIAGTAGKNWQDMSTGMKAASVAGTGLMSAMAGLGAVMLGASGPVGWAVAGVVALGSLAYGMSQVQDGIKNVKKETEKLQEAQENARIANDNYLISLDNLAITTSNLEQIERETGLSGEKLAQQVKNGELSVDNMTAAQLRCYNAYVQNEEMIKQNKKALEDKIATEKLEVEQSIRTEIANAKKTKSYDEVKRHIIDAYENGSLSAEKCRELTERAMGSMSKSARETFMQDLPNAIKEGINPAHYASGFEKFGTSFKNFMSGLGSWFRQKWEGLKSWWNSLWANDTSNFSARRWTVVPSVEEAGGGRSGYATMAVGTNYVPSDGLAYLHQGEAVIPAKYNDPYQPIMSNEEKAYMQQMMNTMRSLDGTMKRGIVVNGEFTQRGSDLVAVVNKTNSQTGSDLLSNVSYAR